MTLEQLRIFVAVAERQHLTRAAAELGLTPSAVSAAIKALESAHDVRLFERVGRGIELSRLGQAFLLEARATLARARSAQALLSDIGGLTKGSVDIHASQTIANYWLPSRLMRFRQRYPGIAVRLVVGNTSTVTQAVIDGSAELGFIEGSIDQAALAVTAVAQDRLVIVVPAGDRPARPRRGAIARMLGGLDWVMRESGSGTRSEFEAALRGLGVDPASLRVALTLPSNEAVLSAVRAHGGAAALSQAVVRPFVDNGQLAVLDVALPSRSFTVLHHKERRLSRAAAELEKLIRAPDQRAGSSAK